MKRFAEEYLENWIKNPHRKPLVLRGARQVGKSTLVRQFSLKQQLNLIEVNLERHLYLNDLFKSLDIHKIILELEALTGKKIKDGNSLIFLDEIQATPFALAALRYFYEDTPEIPVISAGSLLEFTLSNHHFPMPVGRIEYYHLFPMSFTEFLFEIHPELLEYIVNFDINTPIPETAHNKLLQIQREYIFVGGMPEAVLSYKGNRSLTDVSNIHRSIVDTFQDDFSKYAIEKELVLLQKVFNYIPRSLGKKIKYSNISRENRSNDLKSKIELLTKARICHRITHSYASGIPLNADVNELAYKMIFMDIGLANHICGIDWLSLNNMDNLKLINEGGMAEQFIGQHLIINKGLVKPALTYWIRESKSSNAEIDYLMSRGDWILPIEVKAGKSGSLKSLQQFAYEKKPKLCIRFDINKPSLQEVKHIITIKNGQKTIKFNLLSLPLYLVEELPKIIDKMRANI